MFQKIGNLFGRRPAVKGGPLIPEQNSQAPTQSDGHERRQTFSKIFRWRLPQGHTQDPKTVEVVGSFTHWQRVPLIRDGVLDAWHVTMHHIQGNRTHHYMLLVDGQPTYDKTCDGLAVPRGVDEERYQVMTDKGPRVLMLFAQTK
ncbi:MAG TPA: glycogen-binding domain-containing protein [Verrucomicrobiae bacterium]|nr:glycogen-binding domain-containing protein [Verrucomicrobiae bacterium]